MNLWWGTIDVADIKFDPLKVFYFSEDNPASDPFWPALHCFMVILDRLGSKIWGQVDPSMAFQTITGAASYDVEIRGIQHKTIG